MNFRVTQDMYHMTVVIFSTLANGSLTLLKCANKQTEKKTTEQAFFLSLSNTDNMTSQ